MTKFVHKIVRSIISLVLLVSLTSTGNANDITFEAEVSSNKVGLGGAITLTLSVNGSQNISPIEPPELEGFDVRYIGPSRHVSIVNGQYSSSISFKYSLFAKKVGVFQIPTFTLNLENQKYTTQPIAIEVVDDSKLIAEQGQQPAIDLNDKIFLVLKVPKTEVFINEKLPAKVMLFVTDLSVSDIQYPQLENIGFTTETYDQPRQYQQVIKGVRYDIVEFNTVIYPTRTGEIKLGPATLDCNVIVRSRRNRSDRINSIFDDDFFNSIFDRREKRNLTLDSNDTTITVLDLPEEGKPKNFSGAVGNFDFNVTVSPTEVKVGDPITLKMKVNGEGNLGAIQFPNFKDYDDFKFYDPIIKEELNAKLLEQVVIPTSADVSEIPALEFAYFNVPLKKYLTIKKGPFPITVDKLKQGETLKVVGLDPQNQFAKPETLGQDIVFIKNTPGKVRRVGGYIYKNILFYLAIFALLALWIFAFLHYKRTHRLETDEVYARRMHAPKYARKGLQEAKDFMDSGKKEEFYDAIFKTLQKYLANKLHLPSGAIPFEQIRSKIKAKKQDEQITDFIQKSYEECEMVRFASAQISDESMQESYTRLREIIDYLERHMR